MKTKFFLTVVLLQLLACVNTSKDTTHDSIEINKEYTSFIPEDYAAEEVVFYNLFSPVELDYLIIPDQSHFKSTLLNSLNNITKYTDSHSLAMALGIYGADLSYLWMFNQTQQALSYTSAIQRITDELGIPPNRIRFYFEQVENINHPYDSLVHWAEIVYHESEVYLNEFDQKNLSSLILLGGWIETFYIAINMNREIDNKLAAKIAAQKFSAASLYSILQNNANTDQMTSYVLLVKKLKVALEGLPANFPPESLVVDTVKKRILPKEDLNIEIPIEELEEIRQLVSNIRNHLAKSTE